MTYDFLVIYLILDIEILYLVKQINIPFLRDLKALLVKCLFNCMTIAFESGKTSGLQLWIIQKLKGKVV